MVIETSGDARAAMPMIRLGVLDLMLVDRAELADQSSEPRLGGWREETAGADNV
jgi:hypothetical protein